MNDWIGGLFVPDRIEETVEALLAAQDSPGSSGQRQRAERRAEEAEAKLKRLRSAIEAGADPAALVEAINQAQRERAAARAELEAAPRRTLIGHEETAARLAGTGAQRPDQGPETELAQLYEALRLQLLYLPTTIRSSARRCTRQCADHVWR